MTAREKILKYVKEHPGATSGAITEATGLAHQRVCNLLAQETKKGTLERKGERCHYTYTLTASEG